MTKRHTPPGFTSLSWVVVVKPFGPHHCTICLGSVHALKASSRGASKVRVMTICRSADGVVSAWAVIDVSRISAGARSSELIVRRLSSGRPLAGAPGNEGSGRFLAVDHPGRAEPVDQHAETDGPERLLDRHPHRSAFRQCVKNAFRVLRVVDAERYREAFHVFLVA